MIESYLKYIDVFSINRGEAKMLYGVDDEAEAERRLERERAVRRETLRILLETAERTEGDFAVCGYDPMQLRAQDGLLWSGSFLALRQADGTVRRLFGPCAVQLADDPHRATALFVPRM